MKSSKPTTDSKVTKTSIEKRVQQMAADINEFLELQSIRHNYSASEIYISMTYYLTQLRVLLGEERVKCLEAMFQIVTAPTTEC